jgi:hypothetical protein
VIEEQGIMANRKNGTSGDSGERLAEAASKTIDELAREASHQADGAKTEMVKNLYDAAKNMRKQARDAGLNDEVLDRVDDVAVGFEKAASYLKNNSYEDIGQDAVKTVKTYPMQIMAIVFVVGVIIGLLMRGDNNKSYSKRDR